MSVLTAALLKGVAMSPRWFRRLINLWPPLFFSGIKATYISDDFYRVEVMLKLRWYNRNYVGTQFGGSLFAMTDPWYMVMLVHVLGDEYFVWDKGAHIDFVAPGRGPVRAVFELSQEQLEVIREHTAEGKKYLPTFDVNIVDAEDAVIAHVRRKL